MIGLLIYVVAAFGFAYVVGHSVISKRAREITWGFGEAFPPLRWIVLLLECPACCGFWIGLFVGLAGPAGYVEALAPIPALALAFFTAGSNLLLAVAVGITQFPPEER